MKRLGIVSALAIVVIAVSALALRYESRAAAEALPELLELAPTDSTFIAYADVAALRQSPLVQKAAAFSQPPATDGDYQQFVRATGFDYGRDLERVMVAGQAEAAAGATNTPQSTTIAVAEGHFDQRKIVDYALRTAKIQNENGRVVYVMPSVTPGKTVAFSFLSANRIAVSDGDDAFAKPGAFANSNLDNAMRERILRVAGSPFFLAAKTPARSASPANGAPAAFVSSLFQSVNWVDFAARPEGDNVIVSAEAECGTPEDAQKVATALELLRTVVQGAIAGYKGDKQIPPDSVASAERVLKAATITTSADHARLLLTLTPDMIKIPPAASQTAPPAH